MNYQRLLALSHRASRYVRGATRLSGRCLTYAARRGAGLRREVVFRRFASTLSPPYKLHIGCGAVRLTGWINVDERWTDGADVVWDATRRFPLPAGSCSHIHNEHFLEHLSVEQGLSFLRECHRLLMVGGVLRVAMPSLAEPVRQYYEDDWKNQPWLEKYGYTWIQTRAEMLNIAFRYWGHQWLYDEEELRRRLNEAGFDVLRACSHGESSHPDLRGLETRHETLLIIEATKS